ncbi:MAG: hypothetical protein MUF18_02010 [Fimbriiglobus sp.]|nr:hypothetical protein [Fimbriiglobus sp.]
MQSFAVVEYLDGLEHGLFRFHGISEAGEISGRFVATPDFDPCPTVSLKRVKFLFRLGGEGEAERPRRTSR